jgi:hypothetical protein
MSSQDVKKEAKKIMDSFMESLGSMELEEEFNFEAKNCYREEGEGKELDETFKSYFLSNASKTKGDAILAKKGEWLA